jgi:hypothetical protein
MYGPAAKKRPKTCRPREFVEKIKKLIAEKSPGL